VGDLERFKICVINHTLLFRTVRTQRAVVGVPFKRPLNKLCFVFSRTVLGPFVPITGKPDTLKLSYQKFKKFMSS
jgi:hypothetical protein